MNPRWSTPPTEEEWSQAGFPAAPLVWPQTFGAPFDWGGYVDEDPTVFHLPGPWMESFLESQGMTRFLGTPLGFNGPKFFSYEDDGNSKFGDMPAILEDLRTLRARFVRQPGTANLTWRDTPAIPTSYDDIYRAFALETTTRYTRKRKLEELFNAVVEPSLPMVLTLLTYGGATSGMYTRVTDPAGEVTLNTPMMVWTTDHLGNSVTDFLGNTCSILEIEKADGSTYTMSELDPWALNTLDPRSPYKRHYFYLIAKAAVQLLLDLTGIDVPVFENLLALELLNEIDTACIQGDVSQAGKAWGKTVFAVLLGVCEAFEQAGREVPVLWWPAVASWSNDQDFPTVLTFEQALVREVVASATAAGREDLVSKMVNVDLHWYHYLGIQAVGPVMQMVSEVAALKGAFSAEGVEPRHAP